MAAIARLVLMMAVISTAFFSARAFAASAHITIGIDNAEPRVGDELVVTVELSSTVVPGAFEGYLTYDGGVIEYLSGPGCVAGGEGMLKINDRNPDSERTERKYVLYFQAISRGEVTLAMRGEPSVYDDETGYYMPVSVEGITFTVNAAREASTDSTLAVLKVNPGSLSPDFSKNTHEYNVSVDENTEELYVSAMPNDQAAQITVSGNKRLERGMNEVYVHVVAEDGSSTVYQLHVDKGPAKPSAGEDTVEAAEASDSGEASVTDNVADNSPADSDTGVKAPEHSMGGDDEPQSTVPQKSSLSFYASKEEDGVYLNLETQYKVVTGVEADSVKIPADYSAGTIRVSGNDIKAYFPHGDVSSEYLLLVLKTGDSAPGLYCYDRIEKTIQRFRDTRTNTSDSEKGSSSSVYLYVIVGLSLVCALLVYLLMKALTAGKKKKGRRQVTKK